MRKGGMQALIGGICAAFAAFAGAVAAADVQPAIPADEFVFCTVCHGVQLKGNDVIQAPRLSGMETWYAKRQLLAFRKLWRGSHEEDVFGMEMQPMAAVLSEEEIDRAAAYVAAATSEPPPANVDGDRERGRALYTSCAACHGGDGGGNEALNAPALVGLNDWYLVRQLENFRAGRRGGHAGDVYGAQMRAAALVLPDEEAIRDVVGYITGL